MRFLIAQVDFTVGDIKGNFSKAVNILKNNKQYDIAIFPELGLFGYPPWDLLLKKQFIEDEEFYIHKLAKLFPDKVIIIGSVNKLPIPAKNQLDLSSAYDKPYQLENVAKIIFKEKIIDYQAKFNLPMYDIYNEMRYFKAGKDIKIFGFIFVDSKLIDIKSYIYKPEKQLLLRNNHCYSKFELEQKYNTGKMSIEFLGLSVCEDIWIEGSVPYQQGIFGVDYLINLSASPYYLKKREIRKKMLQKISKKYHTKVIYVNYVGAQDSFIFDGQSMFCYNGNIYYCSNDFKEKITLINSKYMKKKEITNLKMYEEIYEALLVGIKDYFKKNNFKKAIIGLSGGIDSALVATLATFALGKSYILGILMPGPYSSKNSVDDAIKLCRNLGINYKIVNIDEIFKSYLENLRSHINLKEGDIPTQNIQARIRGNILMAYANRYKGLVLSTSNKSEMAVGYSTLYGDLAGGLAVISDLYKTSVYKLARYINKKNKKYIIPKNILIKPPSAELKPNQKDQDDLPPYDILDKILKLYIEKHESITEIVNKTGFPEEIVKNIIYRVDINEYKRQQAPIGLKISPKSFGCGRIMPITHGYYYERQK